MFDLLVKIFTPQGSRHRMVFVNRREYLEFLRDVISCWEDTIAMFPDRDALKQEARRSQIELAKQYNKYKFWWQPKITVKT